MMLSLTCLLCLCVTAQLVAGEQYPEEYYGYVQSSAVYDSAFFYAIRGDSNATFRAEAPLVMFLQGGPGATSLFSDYLETGPEKLIVANNTQGYALIEREHRWTRFANMLYVDNPIGTGFSYTKDPAGFSTSDRDIADKLVDFLGKFLVQHPEYVTSDFWIFCESYGGKMTAYFGAALVKAIQAKSITVNFKGVALGDGWVDPVDCMYSYGPYLRSFSQITETQAKAVERYAMYAQNALEEGNGTLATDWWGNQQNLIGIDTGGINWYNSLYYYDYTADNQLNTFLSTNFTEKIAKIIPSGVTYNAQAGKVFKYMSGSFMNDGIRQVAQILNAGYQVNIYTGQVDLIVDVQCMEKWVNKLDWNGLSAFYSSVRLPIILEGDENVGGFVQQYQNLRIFNVNLAGHMVPLDNPPVAAFMMATIVGASQEKIKAIRGGVKGYRGGKPTLHVRNPAQTFKP